MVRVGDTILLPDLEEDEARRSLRAQKDGVRPQASVWGI